MLISLYHATDADPPSFYYGFDLESFSNPQTDFGVAAYFSLDLESAEGMSRRHILRVEIEDEYLMEGVHENGLVTVNYGSYSDVCEDIESMRNLLTTFMAFRNHMPERVPFPADIFVGPRADSSANFQLIQYHKEHGFDMSDDNLVFELFNQLKCYYYTTQVALNQKACTTLLGTLDFAEWIQ